MLSLLATPVPAPQTFVGAIVDNALGLTLLFILLTAIVGAVIKNRRRDRVLKDFDGYFAIVELDDGRRIWGRLRVFPNGLEARYSTPVLDGSGHTEASFFIHQSELAAVRAILRPTDKLSRAMLKRRHAELQRYIKPAIFRRTARFLLIQFSILRDAFMQAFSVLVGQAKNLSRPGTGTGSVLQTQDKYITTMGQTVIGAVHLAYDPMLESLFGQGCVAETKEGDGWRELPGFLKNYSAEWMLVLRTGWPVAAEIVLTPGEKEAVCKDWNITLRREGDVYTIENNERKNVELVRITGGAVSHDLSGREIFSGAKTELEGLKLEQDAPAVLQFNYLEPGDLVLPRTKTLIRHRMPSEELSLLENLGIR